MRLNEHNADVLSSRVSIPDGVVYRSFARETVVLNLETGQYHGLNPTAARMLDVLGASATVDDAAVRLAEMYGRPLQDIRNDLCRLCADLRERQLIDVLRAEPGGEASEPSPPNPDLP